jgi:UPF0271 protein
MSLTSPELRALTWTQLTALSRVTGPTGAAVRYVKAHGALYNTMSDDPVVAEVVVRTVRRFDRDLIMVGLPGSAVEATCAAAGLRFMAEGFPDRSYQDDGRLQPRNRPGAVITDPTAVARHAVALAHGEAVQTAAGTALSPRVGTLCLHGDHPGALRNARAVRDALDHDGIAVRPFVP